MPVSWKKHERDDSRKGASSPMISFRPTGIAFNAELVHLADSRQFKRATLYFDERLRRVGVEFHNRLKDRDAYSVTVDGGGAGRAGGRWLQVTRIFEIYPWLGDILRRPPVKRRFIAKPEEQHNLWVADLG